MRKIFLLLSIFFFFISLYLLVFPQKTYAAPPPPKGLWSVSRCVGGEAKVYFYWDISGYTINGNPVNYSDYNWFLGLGTDEPNINVNDTMPYVYDASTDPPGKTYNWKLRSAEKGTCFFDCNKTVDGPAVTRATCGSEPAPVGDKCYYCESKADQSASFVLYGTYIYGGESREGPYCIYTWAAGGGLASEEPPSDGGNCPADQCNHSTGCVDDPDDAQCIAPVGQCNDETNAFCRRPSTCTDIYCAVEMEGTVYQWTWAYYQQTGQLGTCRPLDGAPDVPPEGGCEDDSQCQSGNECIEGRCLTPKQCIPDDPDTPEIEGNAAEKCLSGICGEDGQCENEGLFAFMCEKWSNGNYRCNTAIGGIQTNPEKFVQNILRILLGLSGGILLVLIIINGYKIMTSQGDPEKLKDAREGIIAAIAGILLIIFSLSILQLITVDIIGIPGFG